MLSAWISQDQLIICPLCYNLTRLTIFAVTHALSTYANYKQLVFLLLLLLYPGYKSLLRLKLSYRDSIRLVNVTFFWAFRGSGAPLQSNLVAVGGVWGGNAGSRICKCPDTLSVFTFCKVAVRPTAAPNSLLEFVFFFQNRAFGFATCRKRHIHSLNIFRAISAMNILPEWLKHDQFLTKR